MSVFTRGPYGRLAVVLNMLSSINIEIIIIIIIIIIITASNNIKFFLSPEKLENLRYHDLVPDRRYVFWLSATKYKNLYLTTVRMLQR